ncbi:fimbrillin family protein [Parabacteroides sp.]
MNSLVKRYGLLCALSLPVLLLAGCSDEADLLRPAEGDRVALEASGDVRALTRAADDSWEAGDEIGIFMLPADAPLSEAYEGAYNRAYRHVSEGRFAPASVEDTIWFPSDVAEKVDFIAYHPYTALGEEPFLPIDLTDTSISSDLLYADRVEGRDKSDPRVAFAFRHALSRVSVHLIAGEGTSESDLREAAFRLGGQPVTGRLDLSDGSIRATGDPRVLAFQGGSAILLPSGGGAGRTLYISLPALGKELAWTLPADKSFAPGEQTVYHVTVKRKGETIDPDPEPNPDPDPDPEIELSITSEIVDWLPGNGLGESGSAE